MVLFNDVSHCVGGYVWKFAIIKPQVSILWPVQHNVNLTHNEVSCLEEVGFFFNFKCKNNLQNLFKGEVFTISNC
jgi:hypothetical protein